MKISLVIPNAGYSGAEKQILLLAMGLRSRGHGVELCNLEGEGVFTQRAKELGLNCKVIRRSGKRDFKRILELNFYLQKTNPDVVISFTSVANQLVQLCKLLFGLKIFHIAGERGRDPYENFFKRSASRILACYSDRIVFNSERQLEEIKGIEKLSSSKLSTIPNGFDFSKCEKIESADLAKMVGIPRTSKVICSIGRFSEPKNIPMFLSVAFQVLEKDDKVQFLYIGDGQDRWLYEQVVEERGLQERINFCGFKRDVLPILKACDLFILTSSQEGIPNVLIEAAAMEVPIISTDVDGIPEIVTNGVTGTLVSSGDTREMVKEVLRFLQDPLPYKCFACDASLEVRGKFNLERMVSSYESLFIKGAA